MNNNNLREVKNYKVKQLPSSPNSDAVYWVKPNSESEVKGYITDLQGIPYPISSGGSGDGVVETVTNTDGNLDISGVSDVIVNLDDDFVDKVDGKEDVVNKIETITGDSAILYTSEKAVVDYVNSQVASLLREEFTWNMGSQEFTLANNYAQVYSVEVQGQGSLSESQYTLIPPNKVEILDELDSGDYIIITYSENSVGILPYYTQAQTDGLINSLEVSLDNKINTVARAVMHSGFIDTEDPFEMYRFDDFTIGITGSEFGIVFPEEFETAPYNIQDGITNITTRNIPLSDIGLSVDGIYIRYVGYRKSDDSVIFSPANFIQSETVAQLGLVIVKYDTGITSFLDVNRDIINQPDISAYSNLETTAIGLKSDIIINHNLSGLTVNNSAGSLKGISVNWHGTNNDELTFADNPLTSFSRLNPGNAFTTIPPAIVTTVDTSTYWNGSTSVTLSTSASATVQRWLVTLNGTFVLQEGESEYVSLDEAFKNAFTQSFENIIPETTFTEIGRLVAIRDTTDLSDTTQAIFILTADGSGGGSAPFVNWGQINGDIQDQTDLIAYVDGKVVDSITDGVIDSAPTQNAVFDALQLKEDISNKTDDIESNKTSSIKYTSAKAIVDWVLNYLFGNATAKTTLVDVDQIAIGDFSDSNKTKKITWANFKSLFKTVGGSSIFGSGDISVGSSIGQIVITTSTSITTDTTDGTNSQFGKHVLIKNGVNNINITVNGVGILPTTYQKEGTGTITFIQGSGRVLRQMSGTNILFGAVGSTAALTTDGTTDTLKISNY